MSGKKKPGRGREISAAEIEEIELHWNAGFSEGYIASLFNRHRWVIRNLMVRMGHPSIRVIQQRRAQEWLSDQIAQRGGRQESRQEDPR